MFIPILIALVVLVLLYLTYTEVKRIREHSSKKSNSKKKSSKKDEDHKIHIPQNFASRKISLILLALIAIVGLAVYFGSSIISDKEIEGKELKGLSSMKNSKSVDKKNSKSQTKDGGKKSSGFFSKNGDKEKTNNIEEELDKNTVLYKFFQQYKHVFGNIIAETGKKVITDKNEFEVSIKNKKVAKVWIEYPFKKEVFNRSAVNLEAAKKTIKKYGALNKFFNPINNSFEIVNEEIKKKLSSPDSFQHIKTKLFEEKHDYIILKVTYEEVVSKDKTKIKSTISKLYLDGKIKIMD